ncbi:MAG: Lon family ATP-dependent protease [Vulcanimicrobiaceae bacterium]
MATSARDSSTQRFRRKFGVEDELTRYVASLYDTLGDVLGTDKLVLRAGKVSALKMLRSQTLSDRICGLARLVFEDPTYEKPTTRAQQRRILAEVEDAMADLVAQKNVEDSITRKVDAKMARRHAEYLNDLKIEALREDGGPETPATMAKLAEIESLSNRSLAATALAKLRPAHLREVIGQENAIRALVAKLASPYPQHVILYGPPGVGKTSVARLVLDAVKARAHSAFAKEAPFVEASGTTLRWDPRETVNPLLGSVHDPIYQGGRRELSESGIPEPKLGLVSKAHGGVLFIDEIGELDPMMQTRLLKVLEDKRVSFESSYYDESLPNVPAYVRKLFAEGAPADFVLIGATTRDPDEIDPAIRSRCAEVYFAPLTQEQIVAVVQGAIRRLGTRAARGVAQLIATYTNEGRKAAQIVADAYGQSLMRSGKHETPSITEEDVQAVVQASRLVQQTLVRARKAREIGKAFGLGVLHHVGSIVEVEAIAFAGSLAGKGTVRFNETAGSMARDSVFNAMAVVRAVAGIDPADFDIHANVVGGGNIDGPSAGLALFLAMYSALTKTPLPQDVAVTGEISINGKVRAVGGIAEKLYAARQAGMRMLIIPKENVREINARGLGIEIVAVTDVSQVFRALRIHRKSTVSPTRRSVASRRKTSSRS